MTPTGAPRIPPQRVNSAAALCVPTGNGPVTGQASGGVRRWSGIPFGAADRFGPARPPDGWTRPRAADRYGPVAPQLDRHGRLIGDEDCLTLNIWSPTGSRAALPVLLWIHGGGFVCGSGADYDGSALAALGPAVVVTVNYRLGALGFLSPDGAASPAVTDLLLALEWVSENIAGFGGDPGQVTLAGHSAGATLTCTLLATPAAHGRFRRAIAFSGAGHAVLNRSEATTALPSALAALQLSPNMIGRLHSLPVSDLVGMHRSDGVPGEQVPQKGLFRPVVDGGTVPAKPLDAVRAGAARDVELWLAWCRNEMAGPLLAGPLREEPSGVTAVDSAAGGHSRDWLRLLRIYQQTGLNGDNPIEGLLTDAICRIPAIDLAEAQSAAGGRVWMSRFDHAPSLPPFGELGPGHGADAACLWARVPRFAARPLLGRAGAGMSIADIRAARALQQAVLRFADGGSPEAQTHTGWVPYSRSSRRTALFSESVTVVDDPAAERRQAWEQLRRRAG